MKKVALLFAGQGTQTLNMHKELLIYPKITSLFKEASKILGYDLEDICSNDLEKLNNTLYTQNAILTTSLSLFEIAKEELKIDIKCALGFSLGELTALASAKVYGFLEITKITQNRALFMSECSNKYPGKMAAIIGLSKEELAPFIIKYQVNIANYNLIDQLVVSGLEQNVTSLINELKSINVRRIIPLNVSGAFHSPLMEEASLKLLKYLQNFKAKSPEFDIIMNVTNKPLEISEINNLVSKQISSSVYFYQSIAYILNNYEIDAFLEIGPGSTLSGLIRKIANKEVYTLNNLNSINLIKEKNGWT